jgi:hypothetical protein
MIRQTFLRRCSSATRYLAALAAGLALAVPAALAAAPAADASTEAWCNSCVIGEYGNVTIANNRHPLKLTYGHALSPSNGWLCAGSIEGNEYTCYFGETDMGFSGQNWFAAVISHNHGSLTLTAHDDY